MLQSLSASQTEYGILSARGHSLYELVPYGESSRELSTQALTDEKLEVVEVLGQTALFTNGRVTEQELPDGLYRYDLREGENLAFATIERNVAVNHAGTILTKAPLDFGGQNILYSMTNTSHNFLGYDPDTGGIPANRFYPDGCPGGRHCPTDGRYTVMMFALDFVLGLILGAAITALAAMALFSYREYQRETAAEIEKLNKRLNETQAMMNQVEMERRIHGNNH